MKDGADNEFTEAVTSSRLGSVERLPKNCQATHVFQQEGSERVLPIKFFGETSSKVWNLLQSEYRGIIVLWLTSVKHVLVCSTNDLRAGKTTTSRILSNIKLHRSRHLYYS